MIGLGLAVLRRGSLEIANPIYREVIPRALTFARQVTLAVEPAAFVRPDGRLDVRKLFTDWQVFWRKDGHLAAAGFGYREAGPHLMLMSFLQRVVNGLEGPLDPPTGGRGAGAPVPAGDAHPGGGRVEREYGLGRGALDLMIFWKADRHVIEVKVRRDTETEVEALDLVARYLDLCGLAEGWLVMFDLRKEPAWTEKLYLREVDHKGKKVWIVGC